jgi:hypothetical protein
MTSLALRKRAILLEAAVHREHLARTRRQLATRIDAVRRGLHSRRWWLVGAAVGLGAGLRRITGRDGWLPFALTAWRVARSLLRR